jgi:hypothetical protein
MIFVARGTAAHLFGLLEGFVLRPRREQDNVLPHREFVLSTAAKANAHNQMGGVPGHQLLLRRRMLRQPANFWASRILAMSG